MEKNYRDLAIKYLSGNASTGEATLVEKLLQSDTAFQRDFSEIKTVWETTALYENHPQFDTDQAWAAFQKRMEARLPAPVVSLWTRRATWYKVAASVVLLLTIGLSVKLFSSSGEDIMAQEAPRNTLLAATTGDEKKVVFLPDGSLVWLSKNSSITYPETFSGNTREVNLEGEAFFDVSKDASMPFIIHAGETRTKVLGTSFTLRAYDNEERVSIDVVTGKVNFISSENEAESILLTAFEKGFYDRSRMRVHKYMAINEPAEKVTETPAAHNVPQKSGKTSVQPKDYLKHSYDWKENFFKQQVLLGEIYNSARDKTHQDVKLVISYYSDKEEGVVVEQFSLGTLLPGESKKYSKKIRKKGIRDIRVQVVDADQDDE